MWRMKVCARSLRGGRAHRSERLHERALVDRADAAGVEEVDHVVQLGGAEAGARHLQPGAQMGRAHLP